MTGRPRDASGDRQRAVFDFANDLRHDATTLAIATGYAGRRWRRIHYWLGGPAAATAAVAGVSAIQSSATLAAVFAVASAVLTSLMTWLIPGSIAGSFLQTSRQYAAVSLRLDAMLRLDLEGDMADGPMGMPPTKGARATLLELQEELHRVRDGSPDVPEWALRAASVSSATLLPTVINSAPQMGRDFGEPPMLR